MPKFCSNSMCFFHSDINDRIAKAGYIDFKSAQLNKRVTSLRHEFQIPIRKGGELIGTKTVHFCSACRNAIVMFIGIEEPKN